MKNLLLLPLIVSSSCFSVIEAAAVRTLPPEIYTQMKTGKKLGKIWINPAWDCTQGFLVGKVDIDPQARIPCPTEFINSYFTTSLNRLAIPGSTNVLSVTVTAGNASDKGANGFYAATLWVEGRIVDERGALMAAFSTHGSAQARETVEKNCQLVMDDMAWSISKDLGKDFLSALAASREQAPGASPRSTGALPPPPAPEALMDTHAKARLLRLEDLRKSGLITEEEYQARRDEIVKSL
jgi:hypothetical protein